MKLQFQASQNNKNALYKDILMRIQTFAIDSDMSFNEVLNLPFWMLSSYYDDGAWNVKKVQKENHDLMISNAMQLMKNLISVSRR